AYVRDLSDGMASTRQVLHLQVEGAQPGCTIECEVSIEDRSVADQFEFQRELFSAGVPVAQEVVYVVGDVGTVKARLEQGEGVRHVKADKMRAWIVPAQPPAPAETLAVWSERRQPILRLAGEEGDWAAVGKDYLGQIKDRLMPEKEVEELAKRLTEGLKTPQQKVAVLARHVQKEVGYKAIEFGVRARRPNAGSETLRMRSGDCKDHALLLHQLLHAAGVPSHLALVNTEWEVHPDMPSLDQFNHMVVEVPALAKGWLIDPTDKSLSLHRYPADQLYHCRALVLDPAGSRLLAKPEAMRPEQCQVSNHRVVTPVGRDWLVEDVLELDGYYASWIRNAFEGLTPADQRDKVQSILAAHGPVQVESFRFEALDDLAVPARLVSTYRVRDAVREEGGEALASLPALWERDYLATRFVKDRQTRFELLYPLHFISKTTVKLPVAAEPASVTSFKQESDSPYCIWRLKSQQLQDREVVLEFDFQARTGEYAADKYPAYHDAWDASRRSWERQIRWRPQP
ncbi:MAG: transglutaminase domain-containing protein, partial [Verrucomicrobium sp.]|nr:transglutaminase domain-containing protein [Verrucomicrobium sp.]